MNQNQKQIINASITRNEQPIQPYQDSTSIHRWRCFFHARIFIELSTSNRAAVEEFSHVIERPFFFERWSSISPGHSPSSLLLLFFSSFLYFFLLCCPLHRIYRSVEWPRACVNDGMTLRLRLTSLSQRGGLPRTRPLPLVNFISRSLLLPVPDQTLDTRCSRHESFGYLLEGKQREILFFFFFSLLSFRKTIFR